MYVPTNNRYTVKAGDNGAIYITDKRLQSTRRYFPREFVYGQMGYNSETAEYPNYVHGLVWNIVDRSH